MTTPSTESDRLSVAHLMLVTAGIAAAFCVGRGLGYLRFSADSYYHNVKEVSGFDPFGMLIAAIYGLSVTVLLIAIRSKDIWSSPGKILALLFATMCLLNWGLELVSSAVMNVRMRTPVRPDAVDNRGYILGIWYRNFAVEFGYVASLPVLLWILVKTKGQRIIWYLVWWGFLLFDALIIGYVHFGASDYLPPPQRSWYFDIAIGIPMALMIVAIASDVVRRKSLDWWTALTAIPIVSVWCLALAMKLFWR